MAYFLKKNKEIFCVFNFCIFIMLHLFIYFWFILDSTPERIFRKCNFEEKNQQTTIFEKSPKMRRVDYF